MATLRNNWSHSVMSQNQTGNCQKFYSKDLVRMSKPRKRNLRHGGKQKLLPNGTSRFCNKKEKHIWPGRSDAGPWDEGTLLGGWTEVRINLFLISLFLSYLQIKMEATLISVCWLCQRIFFCSSIFFFFSLHSGVLDNSGGKILVRKVAGQSGYKGSYSNGVQSLSLPRWRESFIVSGTPTHWRNTALPRHLA